MSMGRRSTLKAAVSLFVKSFLPLLVNFRIVDYNSWIESDTGRRLANSLDKDVVLAEGYKEYKTDRKYMAKMGDWRLNKDEEIELDGIGGVNILVKADVHRAGKP
jgi:hypothetical protein